MSGVTDRLFCSQLKNCLSRFNSVFVLICGFRHGICQAMLFTHFSLYAVFQNDDIGRIWLFRDCDLKDVFVLWAR